MFYDDKRSPDQKKGDDAMADGFFRLLIGLAFLLVLPYLLVSAILGYLCFCAWRDRKITGVACVLFIAVAIDFYFVGLPRSVLMDAKGRSLEFWPGALFSDFQESFATFYHWLYSFIKANINLQTYAKFQELIRFMLWGTLPGALAAWAFIASKKDKGRVEMYTAFKAPVKLWLTLVADPHIELMSKLLVLLFQCCVLSAAMLIINWFVPGHWTVHALFAITLTGLAIGVAGAFLSEKSTPKDDPEKIQIGDDGTSLTSLQLNHHVHVLGESGFGKSVFLMRLITHHVRSGRGLIFIDLKADTETVAEITGLCQIYGRTNELQLFDCSEPEISVPYNVLLQGNPTEIKDKLIGSFSWENSYYKDAAQSFLLTVIRALVFLRDSEKMNFTLEDLYQATLSPDALVALQGSLKNATEDLREDINHLAHYLRNRENFKELHGLRTQIKLLIDSEFGVLLTSRAPGINLFESIKSHKIVYVLLDSQRYGESAKKLGKLILQDLKSASARIINEIPNEKRTTCTIIVDEFADLATEQFVGFLNRARGSGLGIVVAHQEMSDLETLSTTMRDQVMGNTATTVSFLQKMPESAERLAAIAGTKQTVKSTKQLTEQGFLLGRKYTGQESEREVEEFIVHPNEFKSLTVGEAIIVGKYPKAWTRKIKVPRPERISINPEAVRKTLAALATASKSGQESKHIRLKEKVRTQYAKVVPSTEEIENETALTSTTTPSDDPNF